MQRSFQHVPESVPGARRFAAEALQTVSPEALDTAVLMVSELASNCVRHTGSGFDLMVSHTPNEIRVEVTDSGPGKPRVRSPALTDLSGRGLQIIEMLSTNWGVEPRAAGKTVWFTIDLQAAAGVEG